MRRGLPGGSHRPPAGRDSAAPLLRRRAGFDQIDQRARLAREDHRRRVFGLPAMKETVASRSAWQSSSARPLTVSPRWTIDSSGSGTKKRTKMFSGRERLNHRAACVEGFTGLCKHVGDRSGCRGGPETRRWPSRHCAISKAARAALTAARCPVISRFAPHRRLLLRQCRLDPPSILACAVRRSARSWSTSCTAALPVFK